MDTRPWYIEKTNHVVASLSFIYRYIGTRQELDAQTLDEVRSMLSGVAFDATKLLAHAVGFPSWVPSDRELVTSGREADYKLLLARYGLPTTPEARRQLKAEQMARDPVREHAALSELLVVLIDFVFPGAPNERAMVYAAVYACAVDLDDVRLLRDLIERQAEGLLTWDDFVICAQRHIANIARRRDELAASGEE